ncbi:MULTISPECIES: hypothetical protein [unclassified Pseudoalteromonas]|uniref:hypothetical protein n=1 Tax=unclassified Pseudoalteromonas TaxID=194690 RepID=UPI0010217FD7|nr:MULTISPECIES: hypothetical protein [unclassified Pseudoalteromonas]MCG9710505.1 hypothetical protein [Pseudoalteromonas sp. Isolate3]RZD20105.1 hypothetical protein EVU92_18535 [Pseudoalteromonas sp. MEBiC 03485]
MLSKVKTLSLIAAGLLSAQTFAWGEMPLQETKNLKLDAASLSALKVEAGSGFLHITGTDSDEVTVKAEIYQEQPHDEYCLTLEAKGNNAALGAGQCEHHTNKQTRIDLTVAIPHSFNVDVHDASGEIIISHVADTVINDGSGSITANDIEGTLEINDGSGSIDVRNVSRDIKIHDGSGNIDVANALGNIEVHDGSGGIDLNDISGDVVVSDGSGSIRVDTAANFELLSDGSGSVKVTNIAGKTKM